MSKHRRPWLRVTILSFFASTVFVAAQSVTRADPITFTTTGCFGTLGDAPCTSTALNGLTFAGSSSESVSNLGAFTLTGDPLFFADKTFTLNIRFNQPDINNGQPFIFNASMIPLYDDSSGDLNLIGLTIHFDDPRLRTFSVLGPDGTAGVFLLSVNDLDLLLANGGIGTLGGQVAAVPEPASLLLLATGLSGLIGYARRSRKCNLQR